MSKTTNQHADAWSSLNIWLHWLVVVLVTVQYLIGEDMVKMFEATTLGKNSTGVSQSFAYAHIVVGLVIFVAAAVRLWDRFAGGRPERPQGEPNWANAIAKVTHFTLYGLLLAMPPAGLFAWWKENETIAEYHKLASSVLLGVVALHILGALANHFWFKTDALRRIMPGAGRANL